MMVVAICEDEGYILEELQRKVEKYMSGKSIPSSIKTFTSGEELLKAKEKFDIILLDLILPEEGGRPVMYSNFDMYEKAGDEESAGCYKVVNNDDKGYKIEYDLG